MQAGAEMKKVHVSFVEMMGTVAIDIRPILIQIRILAQMLYLLMLVPLTNVYMVTKTILQAYIKWIRFYNQVYGCSLTICVLADFWHIWIRFDDEVVLHMRELVDVIGRWMEVNSPRIISHCIRSEIYYIIIKVICEKYSLICQNVSFYIQYVVKI